MADNEGRISPETIEMINNQFGSKSMVDRFKSMTGIDVTPMLDAQGKLDELEAIEVGAALARAMNIPLTPNDRKLEAYKEAYAAEIEAGTVKVEDLETLSGLKEPEPQPQSKTSGNEAEELSTESVVTLVVPGTKGEADQVFKVGEAATARTGKLTASTQKVDNNADIELITGIDLDGGMG